MVTATTPVRMSSTNIFARSFFIEAAAANTDNIYVTDSESNATTTTRHALASGERIHYSADNYGDLDSHYNLKYFWLDADTSGNKLIITYFIHVTNKYELTEI